MLFSDHNRSLLRAAARSYDHRPKPKGKGKVLYLRWIRPMPFCSLNILNDLNSLKSEHPET